MMQCKICISYLLSFDHALRYSIVESHCKQILSLTMSFGICGGIQRLSEALTVMALNGRSGSEAWCPQTLGSGALSSGT